MDKLTICENRKNIYELLSYCLLNSPREETLEGMLKGQEVLHGLLDESEEKFQIRLEDLKSYEQEYYDRFFVPGSESFVPPYESAIRNRSKGDKKVKYGKLDGKETFHVKACYEMVAFKPSDLNMFKPLKDIQYPDHIAYQMAFMTYLVALEEGSLKVEDKDKASKWRNLQEEFLRDHLCRWIQDFAALSEEKNKGLYSYWLKLAAAWVREDSQDLKSEME